MKTTNQNEGWFFLSGINEGVGASIEGIAHTYRQQLSDIAKMAFGSGRNEGKEGGNGYIGIFDGRVIKYNTHAMERLLHKGKEVEKQESSIDLREKLFDIAKNMNVSMRSLETIQSLLKVDKNGKANEEGRTSLLERKVVAKVINTICEDKEQDYWSNVPENVKSEGKMDFDSVKNRVVQQNEIERNLSSKQNTANVPVANQNGAPKIATDSVKMNETSKKDDLKETVKEGIKVLLNNIITARNMKINNEKLTDEEKKGVHNLDANVFDEIFEDKNVRKTIDIIVRNQEKIDKVKGLKDKWSELEKCKELGHKSKLVVALEEGNARMIAKELVAFLNNNIILS